MNLLALFALNVMIPANDPNISFSPYNWFKSEAYAQTPNPGAYMKVGFTGTSLAVKVDTSPLATVKPSQYPLVRYSVDNGPGVVVQLAANMTSIQCAKGLQAGKHTLMLQYVAGYVFLDFWTPVNVLRVSGLELDARATTFPPPRHALNALFLGDSITNGDDNTASFAGGITNEVDTQDATLGYPAMVSAGIGAEHGVVAYGGASWNGTAADSHTPGLMRFWSMLDSVHSRLTNGKFSPIPDYIFVNMGENSGPSSNDVPNLLSALRAASGPETKVFLIVPFSGRSRASLASGFVAYKPEPHTYLIDLGDNPYLGNHGPTLYSVDGQHPLASLHGLLGAQLVQAAMAKTART